MSETRYEVWWSGKKEWAEPCEVTYRGLGAFGRSSIVKGSNHCEVPTGWLHPVEPEIAPGTLVYAWPNGERPQGCTVFYYRGRARGNGHWVSYTSRGYQHSFDHVEPIAQQPKIDWSKIPESVAQVLRVEGGWLIPVQFKAYPETSEWVDGMRIMEIIPRPKS